MKIAFTAHWDWVLYHFRLTLAERLRARGADVQFICPQGDYVHGLQEAGFRWLGWTVERRITNPLREMAAVVRLARLYRRERFAAVHHFTIKPVLYGSLAASMAGVPTTINTFSGLGFLFSASRKAAALRLLVLPVLRRMLHRASAHTIFQNPDDRDCFLRSDLVAPSRALLIPGSGVDTQRYSPANAGVGDDAPVVLMASRFLWDKGVGEFIEAARLLREHGVRARFWLAGRLDDGNPACVPPGTVEAWRREAVVQVLGHRDDMPTLLRQAAVAVLPSYREGVPRFLLEAAATGLPLVATDVEGCRMVVKPGRNGTLVRPKDPRALADAIEILLVDPALRTRMGQVSRQLAVEEFDEAHILEMHETLYRRLGIIK